MANSITAALTEATGTVNNKDGRHGMDNIANHAQIQKHHHQQMVDKAIEEELGQIKDTNWSTDVDHETSVLFCFDKNNKVNPYSFKAGIKQIAPRMAEILPEFVDRTFWSTWTDMFRIANLIQLEYGVMPHFDDAGRAWQAAQAPEAFAFDKDTNGYTEAHDTEGTLQPMTWQEIAEKRDQGLKPMSNSQYQFFIETCERALTGMSFLIALRELGYVSQHQAADIWQSASESEKKRQEQYRNNMELNARRKAEASQKALQEALTNNSLVM